MPEIGKVRYPRGLNYGDKFSEWTIVGVTSNRRDYVKCQCSCGEIRDVYVGSLKKGKSRKCQRCANNAGSGPLVHGAANTAEYIIWQGIIQRCENRNCHIYKFYGGRGIRMCSRWRESFTNFLQDMGYRPSKEYSIERKDSNGDYEPSNCKWATDKEQANNTSKNHRITANGETLNLQEWAERLGCMHTTILMRIKNGWPEDIAATTPVKGRINGISADELFAHEAKK